MEEIGTVASLVEADDVLLWDGSRGKGTILTVNAVTALDGAYNGASIAVNGTCLTVTSFTDKQFTVGLAPETCVAALLPLAAVGGTGASTASGSR